ncbi:MAG: kelch repeat-containing protein, partial [Methylobacter sp.]
MTNFINFMTSKLRTLAIAGQFIVLLTVTPCLQAQDITGLTDNKLQSPSETGVAGTLREIGAYADRNAYTFTALPNGKTLAYGVYPVNVEGQDYEIIEENRHKSAGTGITFELRLWNPQHHSWQRLDAPPECQYHRFLHTMTPLKNGNILVAGGLCDSPQLLNKQTPYPPHTKLSLLNTNTLKWEATPALSVARIFHTANLLNDDSVLLVGGENDPALRKPDTFVTDSVEAFQNGNIESLPALHTARAKHTATLLNDGTLMVAGGIGQDGKPLNAVEIWDPVERQWRDAPQLAMARSMHSATLLSDGRLMISGGLNADGMPLNSVEIWNPSSNTWSAGKPLIYPLQAHASSLLASGNVLVMGGLTLKDMAAERAMLWSKASEEWRPAGLIDIPMYNRHYNRITLVPLADGSARAFTNYNILQWQPAKAPTNSYPPYGERDVYASTLLNDGRILLTGGLMVSLGSSHGAESPPMDAAEIYDPVSNRFTATGRMNQSRFMHSAIALDNGDVVVAGGWVRTDEIKFRRAANFPEVWNAKTGTWSMIQAIHFEAYDWVHLGRLQDGRVLFFASNETEEATSPKLAEYRAWLWDPQTGLVESKQVPMKAHSGAAIAILPDGRVMRVGGKLRYLIPEKTCPKLQPKRKQYKTDIVKTCQTEAAHWEGATPDPSAEIWDSRSGNVANIAPPPEGHVLDSKSLLLKNGNVVFVEHRPIHPYRNPLPAKILLWDAKSQTWQKLPALADYLTWPMTELDDGSLFTETHYLPPGAQAWIAGPHLPLPFPRLAQNKTQIVQLPSGQLLALSTAPPHAALLDKNSTQWQVQSAQDLAPTWLSPSATVALADGSVMVTALVDSHQELLTAHIWHPKENSWTNAGKLTHITGSHAQALSLPSKNVMHIAIDQRNNLLCDLWQASANTWKDCSNTTVLGQVAPDPGLGLLADGRAVLVASPSRVFVFDEGSRQWSSMKAEWYSDNLTYGAPIRAKKPLLQIFDAAQNTWLDISGVAGKYWQNTHSH